MAITNGYVTRDELKAWQRSGTLTVDDAKLDRAVTAASRGIDHHCDRHFFQRGGTKTFDVYCTTDYELEIGDVVTLSSLTTDDNGDGIYETTWAASDYQLLPLDNINPDSGEVWPRDTIRAIGKGFPIARPQTQGRVGLIQVQAVWGWPEIPEGVKQACLILATRLAKRSESPEGIAGGFDEFGAVRISSKDDPDAVRYLKPYQRTSAVVGIA